MRFSVKNRCPHPAVISGDSRSPATGILQEGGILSVTVTPDSGYILDTLAVTDSRGNQADRQGRRRPGPQGPRDAGAGRRDADEFPEKIERI